MPNTDSSNSTGKILSLSISTSTGTAKKPLLKCEFVANEGIKGDAHAKTVRQVSLLMAEHIEEYNNTHSVQAGPGDFAENIIVRGINLKKCLVGDKIVVGNAIIEVTQIGKETNPLHYSFNGDRLLPTMGVFCKVISNGVAQIGDSVVLKTSQ